jgi:hypothetical protein
MMQYLHICPRIHKFFPSFPVLAKACCAISLAERNGWRRMTPDRSGTTPGGVGQTELSSVRHSSERDVGRFRRLSRGEGTGKGNDRFRLFDLEKIKKGEPEA